MGWLLAAGFGLLALAGFLGLCLAQPRRSQRWLGRRWPGWRPKSPARAAFRTLRLLSDLAALLGVSCATAALVESALILYLGLALSTGLALAAVGKHP